MCIKKRYTQKEPTVIREVRKYIYFLVESIRNGDRGRLVQQLEDCQTCKLTGSLQEFYWVTEKEGKERDKMKIWYTNITYIYLKECVEEL